LEFLGFLFLIPESAPLTSAKCRDGIMADERKGNPSLTILSTTQLDAQGKLPVFLVHYQSRGSDGKTWYGLRGFVATADICGDLEFYSQKTIGPDDPALKKTFESFRFDPEYAPQFSDAFVYAQMLYKKQDFKAAAPIFELALSRLSDDKEHETIRRVVTDQAGMAYGISGDISKARAIFNAAIAKDPDYPLNYYNLACADAEENKLFDARIHLQQAFARKANVLPGERLPDPTKDDSFLPHRKDKEFWKFLESLH
jgi:tetratricopeptide (TPR) repeat protein